MERKRTAETPRQKLANKFKLAVSNFEPNVPEADLKMNSEELFEERKRRLSVLKRVDLTDEEFIDEWVVISKIPEYHALEIGKALGEMLAVEKSKRAVEPANSKQKIILDRV